MTHQNCTACGEPSAKGTNGWKCSRCLSILRYERMRTEEPDKFARVILKIVRYIRQLHIGKLCSKCEEKHDNPTHRAWCKGCVCELGKQRQRNNREAVNKKNREWRARNKSSERAAMARKYASDRRAVDVEKARARERGLYQKNKQSILARKKRRDAAKRGAIDTSLTLEQWEEILNRYGHCCVYCGSPEQITQDHVIPISRGGQHTANNVVPACRWCNTSKGARDKPYPRTAA